MALWLLNAATALALMLWLAASAAANALPRRTWLRRQSFSFLLPEWRFFAPNPATYDYDIFVRFRSAERPPTHPQIVQLARRSLLSTAFNPQARVRKATRDAIDDLLGTTPAVSAAEAERSHGYRALLREASELDAQSSGDHMQFGILLLEGLEVPRLLFVSRWHRLP